MANIPSQALDAFNNHLPSMLKAIAFLKNNQPQRPPPVLVDLPSDLKTASDGGQITLSRRAPWTVVFFFERHGNRGDPEPSKSFVYCEDKLPNKHDFPTQDLKPIQPHWWWYVGP